jgi:hypothetical protein
MTWVLVLGRFDAARWMRGWQDPFDTHALVHNRRELKRIVVSTEGDGGFAVVDIDTLWRHRRTGAEQLWKGRTCKIYTQVGTQWKMIAQTGVLAYDTSAAGAHVAPALTRRPSALSDARRSPRP